jgi:hypothetical protein
MITRRANIANGTNNANLKDVKAFEASLDNKPIFSRDLIKKVAEYVEQVREGRQPDTEKPTQLPHILGGGFYTLTIPLRPPESVTVSWLNAYRLSEKKGKHPGYCINTLKDGCDGVATLKPDDPDHPLRQEIARMPEPPQLKEMDQFETKFLMSKFWAGLRGRLDTLTVPVKNIVCIGLGTLFTNEYASSERKITSKGGMNYRSTSQHLLACSCADYLSNRYAKSSSSSPSPIPILARDPSYKLKDMKIFSHLCPPITVVSDPYEYLSITPNTLVIAISLPVFVPIHEIAADVCFPSGPAAILCNEIFEFPWHKHGLMASLDQRTPRVSKMLEKYDKQWLGKGLEGPAALGSEYETAINGWAQDQFLYARKE